MPALLNAPNTFHNFNYIQFIFTINNSTICLLRSSKRIPTLPTRACMISTMKRRPVRALQTQGVETHLGGVVRPISGVLCDPFWGVLRPILKLC